MNTAPFRTRRTPLYWQKWLIIFAVGILLPLFGVRIRAQAAGWSQLGASSTHLAAPFEDGGGDDDGSDDHGGDRGDSSDDSSDDNGSDDANDDHGGDRGDSSDDSSDDNGSDDANEDRDDGSDDSSSDDSSSDDNGSDDSGSSSSNTALERTGVVTALPATGRQGTWRIDGVTYLVTRSTEVSLAPGAGAITLGQCVKLHIVPGASNLVREIEVETAEHCATPQP